MKKYAVPGGLKKLKTKENNENNSQFCLTAPSRVTFGLDSRMFFSANLLIICCVASNLYVLNRFYFANILYVRRVLKKVWDTL